MTTNTDKTRIAAIYNPQNQTKTQLIESFVVRQKLFHKLFKAIKEAKMEVPEQHYLIQGRRGMGKTTLLLRIAYEIENDPVLNSWLIPVIFNEEEYGIRRLFKLWERIMELLEQRNPEFNFEQAERLKLSKQFVDDNTYERALFEHLSAELKRTGKKIILFIDNFGEMARKLSDEEAHRLRKILQTSPDIRIIAASAVVLESFYRYDHPFYEFFRVEELKGLDKKETRDLLLSLSEHYKKETVAHIVEQFPGRIEALRRITGGVIRTIVLLFEIFADDDDGSAFNDLELILDRVTPLYKHRMDDLSDQQQAIVEAIALNWDALSVKEIAEQTRLESKIISAQLQNLEKNGIVLKVYTKTKNHYYIIAERFFNIWFLMRNGRRNDEKRVRWLVQFLEEWCDEKLIENRPKKYEISSTPSNTAQEPQLLTIAANQLPESKTQALSFLTNTEFLDKEPEHISTYLILILAKGEKQWLFDLFNSPEGESVQLKDRFKPIYYAVLKSMDHPDYLRMGEELVQTIDEILARAAQMAVDYA